MESKTPSRSATYQVPSANASQAPKAGAAAAAAAAAASSDGKYRVYNDEEMVRARERAGGGGGGIPPGHAMANSMWVLSVAKTGLIGLVMGTVLGAIRGTATDQGLMQPELDPQPEAFDLDLTLGKMFHKLAKYRHLHEESYRSALRYCDQVLLREREIARSRNATAGDYDLVETFIQGALAHLMAIRNRAPDGQSRADLKIIKDEIAAILHDHRVRVRHLCANTRI
jgi:hypothetical protein